MTVVLPLRTVSEKNTREHWRTRARRVAGQRGMAKIACWQPCAAFRKTPVTVLLTRVAPQALDDDNVAASLSGVRDGVADALQTNDRDPLVLWRYGQRRGRPREYSVLVHLEATPIGHWAAPPLALYFGAWDPAPKAKKRARL
jgi:hypothetical protein